MAIHPKNSGQKTKNFITSPVGAAVLISLLVIAVAPAAQAIKFKNPDGYAAVDLEVEGMNRAVADGTLKLKLETKRENKVKASTDVELNYNDRELYIEELKIDYKASKRSKWTFGIDKKIIGLEYEHGKKYRLTVKRGPIYKKMEELGIVGRQFTLKYDRKLKKKLHLSTALGGDNGRNFNGTLSLQKKKKDWGLGSWYLLESHRINQKQIPVFVQSYAFWYRPEQGAIALELFHGIDAERTEYEKDFGDNRTVHFSGAKFEISSNHHIGQTLVLSPLFQTSFWIDDLKHSGGNTLQFLAGVNLTRGRLRFSINAETFGVKLSGNLNERKFNRTNGYVEITYFF